ncbi:1,6-anhydro-N-acetylmuramyl-L-alanine amidase AmpD [Halopseudomonas sp.]|uniref:1,6-anhydro-N-acetylmuramyl-L-alanine amidase AmpD n=1 Tax=Halopseudomonas sp. TaxID=2901191 RepID=UPI003561D407
MQIRIEDGWVSGVQTCPSPHCNSRPPAASISLLVIHNISLPPGQYGGGFVQEFFTGTLDPHAHPYFAEIASLRVSAHFLIERHGEITQFVSCLQRAWHAGASCFGGCTDCNDFSIGIELEGTDTQPYSDAQYHSLVLLTQGLQAAYPEITSRRITGHEFIAPQRKTDPGPAFDWQRYLAGLAVKDGGQIA